MKERNIFKLYQDICKSCEIMDVAKFKEPVSDQDYACVMHELRMRLDSKQYDVLVYRYGLSEGDDAFHSPKETSDKLGFRVESVRRKEENALRTMRNYNRLPAIFGFFEMPEDPDAIEHLRLSVRARECLRRYAGVTTISGIKNFDGDWTRIRNMNRSTLEEIELKMNLAGYPFKIHS
ncbi:hypothetical protein IKG13_03890 [Candidatus Saccharibacteria bacterium]|nr:hypothetical protein [Candidatus Saccharibacteria bacterium]